MKADLHCHSKYSDGTLDVSELLDIAISRGLDYLAITDHDCFEGSNKAICTNKNIKVITGIELSTLRNNESVHILGYFSKPLESDTILLKTLDEQLKNRKQRALKIIELLEKHASIKLDPSFVSKTFSITRGTIAREIIKQGYKGDKKELFSLYLGDGKPCYIPSSNLTTQEGISLIHKSGGIAILAHPCLLKKNDVKDIIDLGVDGLEAIYPKTFNNESLYKKMAKDRGLLITAGSDFHTFGDSSHGSIADKTLKGNDLNQFLRKLYEY